VLCPSLCLSSECCAYLCVYLRVLCLLNADLSSECVPISVSIFRVQCLLNAGLSSECCAHHCVYLQSAVPSQCRAIFRVLCPCCAYLQSAVPTKCRSVSIFKVHPNDADLCVSSEWDANLTCVDVCQRVSTCVDVCRRVLTLLYLCVCRHVSILRVLCPCCADPQSAVPSCVYLCVYLQSAVQTQCRSVSIFGVHPSDADLCVSTSVDVCLSSECCAYSMPICVYLQSAVPTQCRSASISVSIFRVLCPSLCVSSECCAHFCVYL